MIRLLLVLLLWCPLALAEPSPESRARTVLHSLLGMAERRAIQFGNYQEAISVLRFHRQVLAGEPQPRYSLFLNRLEVVALIAPIAQDISNDSTLAVVASGPLNYVPFAALEGPPTRPGYLGNYKICVNLVGVSDILRLSETARAPSGRLLALGNPDGTLPAASDEVKSIATMFSDASVYLGPRANRESLNWTGDAPDVVHIATHGQLDSSHPQASFLVLAGHKLRVSEIYTLPLKGTELVSLSACQTALGEVEPGSEITSLADAFQVAGSRSVLASLWNVADASTSQFMQAFYRNRQKSSLGEAFHLAQLQLMQQPATAHPYYWAPFILLGDFR